MKTNRQIDRLILFVFAWAGLLVVIWLKPGEREMIDRLQVQLQNKIKQLPANETISPAGDVAFYYYYNLIDAGVLRVITDKATGHTMAIGFVNKIWIYE